MDKDVLTEHTIQIEERQLNYLLQRANLTIDEIDVRFRQIDDRMNRVSIGLKMIDTVSGTWDDFPVEIVEITDKANGIVKILEPGINQYREMSILSLSFEDEERCMKI